MVEGFMCDKCKRFFPNDIKYKICEKKTFHSWDDKYTFCKTCYELVYAFIRTPQIYIDNRGINDYILDLEKAMKQIEREWKEKP